MIDLSKLVTAEQHFQLAKSAKNLEINVWRLSANKTSFTYFGKKIACDDLSLNDIQITNNEIVNLGDLPPDWIGGWKAIDNTYIPITTVEQWRLFHSAMFSHRCKIFTRSQAFKSQLENAKTIAQINKIYVQ